MGKLLRIGLTGGIGSGKSTACKIFADLGVPVIDADTIAHQLSAPGQPAYVVIAREFGSRAVGADGELDRQYLRQRVFSDAKYRRLLEGILHPLIFDEIENRISLVRKCYCIICIPLLIETQAMKKVDRVLLIDAPQEEQIMRASKRDGTAPEAVIRIIGVQATREQRLATADDVIHNDGDLEHLQKQIVRLDQYYKSIMRNQ